MKDYSQIVTKITSTPWMITPGALQMMLEIFDAHLSGQITQEEIRVRLQAAGKHDGSGQTRNGSVGVLPLYGPIFPRANMMTELSGATSLEQFQDQFRSMMGDDSITSILLDVDSPGGLSDLVPEMAQEIREAREKKPIYAIANTAANSAAYFLASQATKMYATPSAQLGSIGTYLVHSDDSEFMAKLGKKETVIKAGRFKAAMIESLTPETREHLQKFVNDTNDQFVEAVALGRDVTPDHVRENYGEGGVFAAKPALELGMIDGIATFDQVMSDLSEGGGNQTTSVAVARSMSGAPERRESYDADKEHSEPGTGLGGEPTPREPPEKDDPAIEGGWRRDPPPPAYETEESVNREWLEARAEALNISFSQDTTDEELAKLVAQSVNDIVVPLHTATAEAEKARRFEEDYPEQAAALMRLQMENRATEARTFADGYSVFEGQNRGYSPVVRGLIAESHAKIASRQFTHEDLKALLDATSDDKASVPLGESGSSRTPEVSGAAVTGDFKKDRQQFADLVRAAMTDDGLTRAAALEHVSKQHPELAEAYATGHVR